MKYKLLRYDEISEAEYEEYISEWENRDEQIVPSSSKRVGTSFSDQLKKWKEDESDNVYARGYVPSTLYFFMGDDKKVIGSISYRHALNERLLENGGSIAYGVRASQRRKGFASTMLKQLLHKIKEIGVEEVLLTCGDDNIVSARTIEKCGGGIR